MENISTKRVLNPKASRRQVLLALGYYQARVQRGIAQYARKAGWILNTQMTQYGIIPDYWVGDGIITFLVSERPDITDYVRKARVPVVDISADVQVDIPLARVVLDNYQIGKLAAEHLIERNFKNLAFYQFIDSYDIRGRLAGFKDTVQAHKLNFYHLNWSKLALSGQQNWFQWLRVHLLKLPRPLGLCAQSDNRAMNVFAVCENLGIAVPEDLAIIGVDNDEMVGDLAPVPLSSVDSDRFGLGYRAAEVLDQIIISGKLPSDIIIHSPGPLVLRKSTDIYAVENPDVVRALGFIWEYYNKPITVQNVIASTTLSRAELYRAFEKHLGHSIGKEITRKRLERVRKLLVETTHKLNHIASKCGFSNDRHMIRVFQREMNMSPSQYRNAKLTT